MLRVLCVLCGVSCVLCVSAFVCLGVCVFVSVCFAKPSPSGEVCLLASFEWYCFFAFRAFLRLV